MNERSRSSGARPGDRGLIKAINRNLVLNLIKSKGPISRRELARLSGLSPASVSTITRELLARGFVHEIGEGESRGGRRPVLLRLNHAAGFVVGVKVTDEVVTSAITDLDARVLHHRVTPLQAKQPRRAARALRDELPEREGRGVHPDAVLGVVIDAIEKTIRESGVSRRRVLGIGMGLAGVIDGEAGVCRYSPFFGWRHVPVADPIARHFRLPVYLENDVNTLTIAEQWFGHGHGVDHFVVVTVGRGVGAGFVLNGQFYRGADGGAGEVGHVTMREEGPQCECGKRGCLEALASDPAVIREVRAALARGEDSVLGRARSLSPNEVFEAAEAGDRLARRVLAEAGRWLGVGIALLVNLINPHLVIVGGEGVRAGEWRLGPMREALSMHTFAGLGSDLRIVVEPAGDETWARGAACVVLGELFKSPVHRRSQPRSVLRRFAAYG